MKTECSIAKEIFTKMRPVAVDESNSVILFAFLVHAIADGLRFAIGLIGTMLIERRHFSREAVAWIATVAAIAGKVLSFVSSGLYHKYGCRVPVLSGGIIYCFGYAMAGLLPQKAALIFLSVGVISGLGHTLVYIPTWIAANTYYQKRRQLANGFVMSGSAIGTVVFSPLVNWLLDGYGLQGTFLILAGSILQVCVIGALIPPLSRTEPGECQYLLKMTEQGDSLQDSSPDSSTTTKCTGNWICLKLDKFIAVSCFSNWKYVVLVVSACLSDPLVGHTMYTYIPDFIIHKGYRSDLTWPPIAAMATANTVSRLAMGANDKPESLVFAIYTVSSCVISVAFAITPFVGDHYVILCLVSATFGFFQGLYWSLRGPVIAAIVNMEDFDKCIGTVEVFSGFTMLVCPFLGKLYDVTGEYTWTFIISGLISGIGGCLLVASVAVELLWKKS